MKELAAKIGRCNLFSTLSVDEMDSVATISNDRSIPKGETIFSEGDEAISLYILSKGSVRLVKFLPDGRETTLRVVEDGETFAEAAVFFGSDYPATAIASEKSEIISIEKRSFIQLISKKPAIALKMLGVMASLLRHLNVRASELKSKSVAARTASILLKCAKESGRPSFKLTISKGAIASMIGTIPATLSRNLKELKKNRVIDVKGDLIEILDMNELKDIAEGE